MPYAKTLSRSIFFSAIIVSSISLLMLLTPPQSQSSNLWKNPPVETVLDNGLTVIYQKDDSSAITVMQITILGGKAATPIELAGLSHITTRLTIEIPDSRKLQKLMSQASSLYMGTEGDYSFVVFRSLSENLEETLETTSKMLLKPLFSGIRISKLKEWMLHIRNTQEDDAIQAGYNVFLKMLFGDKGYGGSIFGDEKSLKSIKTQNIKEFYKKHFIAENLFFTIISDLEQEVLIKFITKYFSKIPSGSKSELALHSAFIPEERQRTIEKDTKQYFVSAAFPLPELTPRNFTLNLLVENLLGKGINSRLWSLRANQDLAYNVNSRATQMRGGGILEAYLETDKKKKGAAIDALKEVLNLLFENGISQEEFETTKTNLKGEFLRNNETKEARTRNLASYIALGLGYKFFHDFLQEIDAISLEEINAHIRKIFNPERRAEVIIGPKDEIEHENNK